MKKYLPILAAFAFFSIAQPVNAQVSLIVSPPSYDEAVKPGTTIQKTVKITNDSDTTITLQAKVYDFIVQDDEGTPIIVTENASGRYLASPWFTLDRTRITIAPKATEQVYALVKVPQDALPGGHYAGIYLSPVDVKTPSSTGAGVLPQIGSLFRLTIEGDIKYDALIKEFNTKQNLYEFGPVEFSAVIENQSDTHISPTPSINIKDMLGRRLATLPVDKLNIFPFKDRTITTQWDQVWGLGKYQATLSVPYGNGQVAERTIFFWILPWRILAAVIVVLLLVIALTISVRRHLKHRSDTRDTEIESLKRRIVELENNHRQ